MREKIRCLLTGFYGAGRNPTGGTIYGYTLVENPPEGVEYLIPAGYKNWKEGFLHDKLSKQESVEVDTRLYSPRLNRFDKLMWLKYNELSKTRIRNGGEVDLIHSMSALLSVDRPYVCSVESDKHITKKYGGRLKRLGGYAYSKAVMKRILDSRRLKKILFWSEIARQKAVEHTPSIGDKSRVVYPGVELPEIKKKKENGRIRLCFVGGDWMRKGLMMLEQTFMKLRGRYDLELAVVTDASYERTEPDSSVIRFYDLPYWETFPDVYLDSDVFVLPSRDETFGYSLLEAMACGLPTVASNVYAIPEIVEDGKTGYLTPYGDLQALEEKLIGLIEDDALRRRMGEAGRRRAEERFGVKEFTKKVGGVYQECVKK